MAGLVRIAVPGRPVYQDGRTTLTLTVTLT
jgi:hypothetical protein